VPPRLLEQLAEGGHLVLPVGSGEDQHLLRLHKAKGEVTQEDLGPVRFVPLAGGKL
jgi:protein-L-isoaspartate(D-aspartate) O-methyltransferase